VRSRAIFILKCAVAAGLLYVLLAAGLIDLRKLAGVGDRWGYILAAQACFVVGLAAAAVRWYVLLHAQSIPAAPREVAGLVLIGWCFNQTMPSSTGGDVARAVAIAVEHPTRRHAAVVSIAADRALGLVSLLATALIGAAINFEHVRARPTLAVAVAGIATLLAAVVAAIGIFYSRRTRALATRLLARLRRAERASEHRRGDHGASMDGTQDTGARARRPPLLARAVHAVRALAVQADEAAFAYRHRPRAVLTAFAAASLLHLATIALNVCMAWALLGEPFDWAAMLLVIPLAHALMVVGVTPGALGVTEGIYATLLPLVGIPQGATIAILQRLTWLAWAGVGAGVFMLRRGHVRSPEPLHDESLRESRAS
jgi:glycosyltransferase 2 family protein